MSRRWSRAPWPERFPTRKVMDLMGVAATSALRSTSIQMSG